MNKYSVLLLVVMLFAAAACASSTGSSVHEGQSATKDEIPNITYYTFSDVPIPRELELVRDRSFVYETSNVKAGVLVLSGNIDIDSLEQYFKANMPKNGWRLVSDFKYATVILNYMKDDKAALIRMSRENFSTVAEIWVGPVSKPEKIE
jgi:hypothetical protein